MRGIICISLLVATPAMAELGCFAARDLADRPVVSLDLYVFYNAARQGRYAAIRAETADTQAEMLAPCPTDTTCVAPCEGGVLAIRPGQDGIDVLTDRFVFDCDGLDLGNGSPLPERYQLTRADGAACGGPG